MEILELIATCHIGKMVILFNTVLDSSSFSHRNPKNIPPLHTGTMMLHPVHAINKTAKYRHA